MGDGPARRRSRGAGLRADRPQVSGFYYDSERPWEYPHSDALCVVRALYEAFGSHRMCWGSDYPVVRRALAYRQSIEAFRTHCVFAAPADRDAILGGTLEKVLRTRRPIGVSP